MVLESFLTKKILCTYVSRYQKARLSIFCQLTIWDQNTFLVTVGRDLVSFEIRILIVGEKVLQLPTMKIWHLEVMIGKLLSLTRL